MSTKVGMISLGCAKNLVDAEIMLGSVLQRGMEITSRAEEADVLVVNTCAFIDSAKEESIDAILDAHQQRGLSQRPNQKLIVSGCMSQRFSHELREQMPEVDEAIVATYLADGNIRRIRGALHPLLKAAPLSKSAVSRVIATLRDTLADAETFCGPTT